MKSLKFRAILNDESDFDEREPFVLKPWMRTALFFAAWFVILNLCAVLYIKLGANIYIWDNAVYWDYAKHIADGAISQGFFKTLYMSVNSMTDNYIAALPSALFALLFGESRLVYVLGLMNFYVMPYLVLVYLLAKKIGKATKITASLVMMMMPVVPFAALVGFADLGGLVICMLCYNLYYTKKDAKPKLTSYIMIGILLVFMAFWRSWYSFFAVSFITAMIADSILFKRKWYYTAASVAVAALILVLFFRGFVRNVMIADYGASRIGYMNGTSVDFKLMTRYFGIILLVGAAVCSVLIGVYKKEKRTAFLWIQILVCMIMFIAVRQHTQANMLLYVPSLTVMIILIIRYISKEWMLVAAGALAIFQTVSVCLPRQILTSASEIRFYAPIANFSVLPAKRADAEQILQLKKTLDGVVGEGETLGVMASSTILNGDILRNVETSLGASNARTDYLYDTPQIDAPDLDLEPLYLYNYMLVAFPAQTHFASGQTTLIESVNSFENWTDFAMAYEEMYDYYTVIDGIEIKLFRRVREVDGQEKADFMFRLGR